MRCILDTQIIAHKALRNTSDQIIRLTFTWPVIELPESIKHIIAYFCSAIWVHRNILCNRFIYYALYMAHHLKDIYLNMNKNERVYNSKVYV